VEIIEGLRTPDGGTVRVLGLDPRRDGAELRQRVGVQLQESQLPDKLKVAEALEEVMPAVLRRTGDFARSAPACMPCRTPLPAPGRGRCTWRCWRRSRLPLVARQP
jgi:hypothetical protein